MGWKNGRVSAILKGHKSNVNTVTISPDGTLIAFGSGSYEKDSDNTIRIWEMLSRKERVVLEGHKKEVLSVIFSSDGKLIASGSADKTIRIWEVLSGQAKILCCKVIMMR